MTPKRVQRDSAGENSCKLISNGACDSCGKELAINSEGLCAGSAERSEQMVCFSYTCISYKGLVPAHLKFQLEGLVYNCAMDATSPFAHRVFRLPAISCLA